MTKPLVSTKVSYMINQLGRNLAQMLKGGVIMDVVNAEHAKIAEKAGVARPTGNQALDKLLRLKKVERIGLGRSTRYRKL